MRKKILIRKSFSGATKRLDEFSDKELIKDFNERLRYTDICPGVSPTATGLYPIDVNGDFDKCYGFMSKEMSVFYIFKKDRCLKIYRGVRTMETAKRILRKYMKHRGLL